MKAQSPSPSAWTNYSASSAGEVRRGEECKGDGAGAAPAPAWRFPFGGSGLGLGLRLYMLRVGFGGLMYVV